MDEEGEGMEMLNFVRWGLGKVIRVGRWEEGNGVDLR